LGALFCALFPNTTLGFDAVWKFRFALCFVPVILYGLLILPCKFPVNERVAAGVSYRDMLKEVGAVGFFMITALIVAAVYQMAGKEVNWTYDLAIAGAVAVLIGLYTRSLGNWLFIMVLVIIGPLATTELGTDGWMPELLKLNGPADSPNFAAWVFRVCLRHHDDPAFLRRTDRASFLTHRPAGHGSGVAIVGLLLLSKSVGWTIVGAATIYAFGKTFLWSTTLGLTSEQFPKGGALTLNGVSAVGVLFLGVLGSPFIGYQQDQDMHSA
jgi:DHA2 family metal-tetracycline-proton antiporter-like MFS transporter